jgi:hypothetical protein
MPASDHPNDCMMPPIKMNKKRGRHDEKRLL